MIVSDNGYSFLIKTLHLINFIDLINFGLVNCLIDVDILDLVIIK